MMSKIVIRGRETQPNLVIEYLEELGGINEKNWNGDDTEGFYWIDDLNRIRCTNNIPEGYQFLDNWYKKDNKLIELPKTWKEFCKNYPVKKGECWIGARNFINICKTNLDKRECRNWIPSEKSAKAHLALIQLEQLRDCYRQGDIPDFNDNKVKYCIYKVGNCISVRKDFYTNYFLSFSKKEIAEEFLTNFKPLIKIAEDYI